MKLNVGCGNRCFPDYLNIDLDDRKADYPYLKADAGALPLEDEVADELLSVHLIEHIWPWDVANLMREWKRVLKPGGKIIVECPNLANAAAMFYHAVLENDLKLQGMLMRCFYGDPKDQDLPGRHKWGYTPKTLCNLLENMGFKNARQEPAQFKMREPRDMRIVAEK